MMKRTLILMTMLCLWMAGGAQVWPWHPLYGYDGDTSRTSAHLSVGSMVGAGFGRTDAVGWVAPSFGWRASERLTLRGGFAVTGTLMPGGYALHGRGERSLTPVREGTRMGAVWAQAEYRVGERLLIWGSAAHITGYAQPLWAPGAMPVDATAVSGGMAYRFGENTVLAMHFRFVHDEYGFLMHPPYGHGYYGPLAPDYTLYNGPWPF